MSRPRPKPEPVEDPERVSRVLAEAERIAHVGSWEWDARTGAMTWTSELYEIYGLEGRATKPSLEAYLKQIHTEDRQRVKKAAVKARAEGVPFSFDHRIFRPDGEMRVVRLHGGVHRDDRGKVTRVIGTAHDVTKQRRLESLLQDHNRRLEEAVAARTEALRSTELRLRTILDAAPVILWATDKDGVITLSRGKGLAALGIKPDEHVGKSVYELYKKEPRISGNIRRVLKGEAYVDTLMFANRTFEAYYTPLKDKNEKIIGMMGVAIDVTDTKPV